MLNLILTFRVYHPTVLCRSFHRFFFQYFFLFCTDDGQSHWKQLQIIMGPSLTCLTPIRTRTRGCDTICARCTTHYLFFSVVLCEIQAWNRLINDKNYCNLKCRIQKQLIEKVNVAKLCFKTDERILSKGIWYRKLWIIPLLSVKIDTYCHLFYQNSIFISLAFQELIK